MSAETEPARSGAGAIVTKLIPAMDGRRIHHLHLNRPEKRNALTLAMLEELHRCLAQEVEEIVITSAGPSFCAGLDLDECRRDAAWPRPLRHLESLTAVYRQLLDSPASVIACVQGFAVGGGIGLAACADLVMAAEDARLRLPNEGELTSLARIVQPVVEARQLARCGKVAWLAGDLNVRDAKAEGLVDEILAPEAFATLRASAGRNLVPCAARQSSWRRSDRSRTIHSDMRAILTDLSRRV